MSYLTTMSQTCELNSIERMSEEAFDGSNVVEINGLEKKKKKKSERNARG